MVKNMKKKGIKQINDGHNISECKESCKNSNGLCKSSYQRSLDEKGEKLIKEKKIKLVKTKNIKFLKV